MPLDLMEGIRFLKSQMVRLGVEADTKNWKTETIINQARFKLETPYSKSTSINEVTISIELHLVKHNANEVLEIGQNKQNKLQYQL